MSAVMLALGAAPGWGASDFMGGLKTRRVPLFAVLLISQVTALAVLIVIVAAHGTAPPSGHALALAAVAGVSEMVAVAALYRGLATGTMTVVAPVAAMAPIVPLLAGLIVGELPGAIQLGGLVLAIAGVVITSLRRGSTGVTGHQLMRSMLNGGVAALGFGIFFFTMHDAANEGDTFWALLTARLTTVVIVGTIALLLRRSPIAGTGKRDLPVIVFMGVLVVAADTMYATATTHCLVSVAAVLASLHTVVTIGLARFYLSEQLQPIQQFGVLTSLSGVLVVAAT